MGASATKNDTISRIIGTPHPSQQVCAKVGTKLNPVNVLIRSHERQAMVFRYLVCKGIEMAVMGMLTRGQKTEMITDTVNVDMPNLPVELALRQGMELAIKGQVEKNQWFFINGERSKLFLRGSSGDIVATYDSASGKEKQLEPSSIGGFVDKHMDAKEREQKAWDDAYSRGLAI